MSDEANILKRGCGELLLIGLAGAIISAIIGTSDPYADTLKQIRQDAALRRAQDIVLTRAAMPTRTATPTPTMTPTATSTPTATPIYGAPVAEK
jgi:hypothetical protein